jgi:hypothetical protein
MALTANYVPKYKGLSGTHPQLENSAISETGGIATITGRAVGVTTQTTTYSVGAAIEVVVCNSATAFTVSLPAASGGGRIITIKNINTGAVSIDPDGTDTIDGTTSEFVLGKLGCMTVVDYAANKWVVLY